MSEELDIHMDCKWDIAAAGPTENPLQSICSTLSSSAKDMSVDRRDAWLYGIAVGWDDGSYKELQVKHNWNDDEVLRNKRLHQSFIKCWNLFKSYTDVKEEKPANKP